MKTRITSTSLRGFLAGVALLALPAMGHAVLISTVTVEKPGSNLNDYNLWTTQIGAGINLNPGQQLILTQNAAVNSGIYNFDTSEDNFNAGRHDVVVNGLKFNDTTGVLLALPLAPGGDPLGSAFNEAQEWKLIGQTATFAVYVAYADDAHTNACLDGNNAGGGASAGVGTQSNCHPDPWQGSANTQFFGNAITGGCARTLAAGFNPAVDPCYDAGAILIVALQPSVTPEPSAVFLLGAGLVGLAALAKRKKNK